MNLEKYVRNRVRNLDLNFSLREVFDGFLTQERHDQLSILEVLLCLQYGGMTGEGQAWIEGLTEEASLPSVYFLRDDYDQGGMAQVSRTADPRYKLFNKDILRNIIYRFLRKPTHPNYTPILHLAP